MTAAAPPTAWLFVVHAPLHLADLKLGEESWWCVDRRCRPGEIALVYRPLRGVICLFRIVKFTTAQSFCNSYAMGTTGIEMLQVFEPPISAKQLRSASGVRGEALLRKNFQGKSFPLSSLNVVQAVTALVPNNEAR